MMAENPRRLKFLPCNRHIAGDVECCDGVVMDIDEYTEGWQPDVIYPPCDCNPRYCATCKGTGDAPKDVGDSDDCPECSGIGWRGKPMWPRRTKRQFERTA